MCPVSSQETLLAVCPLPRSEGIGKDVNEAASGLTCSQQPILETDAVGLDPWFCPYWLSELQRFRVQDGRTLSWICEYVSVQMRSADVQCWV